MSRERFRPVSQPIRNRPAPRRLGEGASVRPRLSRPHGRGLAGLWPGRTGAGGGDRRAPGAGLQPRPGERALTGVGDGLEAALAAHQARLEADLGQVGQRLDKVRELRRALARGEVPVAKDLAGLVGARVQPIAACDLPWPWGGELFEVREPRPITLRWGGVALV
jgi:hypothetical protein